MKKIVLIILLLLLTNSIWGFEEPEKVLTLADSIKWAMTNNQELLVVGEKKNIAYQKIKEADSYFFPRISLTGAYTRLNVNTPTTLPPTLGGSSLAVGVSEHYATRASLTQNLFTGGYLTKQRTVAKLDWQEVDKEYEEMRRNITLEVSRAFYDVLYYQDLVGIYKEAIEQLSNSIGSDKPEDSKNYQKMQLELQRNNLQANLDKTGEDLIQAKLLFNKIVGFELNTQIKLVGEFSSVTGKTYFDLNACQAQALERCPEIKRLKMQEDRQQAKIEQFYSQRFPTVVLGADYEYSGNTFPLRGRNWDATLAVNFPLFSGWIDKARIRQARQEQQIIKFKKVQVTDDIKLRVEQAYRKNKSAARGMENVSKNKDLAQKSVEMIARAFQENKATYLELIGAYNVLLQTKINHLQHNYDYTMSELELQMATGEELVK